MKQYKRTKRYVYTAMALATLMTLSSSTLALAEDNNGVGTQLNTSINISGPQGDSQNNQGGPQGGGQGERRGMPMGMGRGILKNRPGVMGVVTAVSGNTITVTGKKGFGTNATDVTYTVDASNAVIIKNKASGSITDILVGDTIMAQGTLTGTNLVASTIRDGKPGAPGMMGGKGDKGDKNSGPGATTLMTGNGQPIVAGAITAVSGSTVTITNKSNATYTIDATSAKILKGQNTTATVSDLAVGDMIIAQGSINGSAVVATTIIDQSKLAGTTTNTGDENKGGGFFGGMGSFFAHIFGF